MKHFLALLFCCFSIFAAGQVTVVVYPADTLVCYRDSVSFSTLVTQPGTAKITYQWQKDNVDLTGSGAQDSIYTIAKADGSFTGVYRCIVSVEGVGTDTSNNALLRMNPRMYIDTLYRYNALGCANECKGQFKVRVSGGTPPYEYHWGGGKSQDTIVFGLCRGHYTLTVTDAMSCDYDTSYYVDVLKSPKVTFEINPDTVIYTTNPTIQVVFPETMYQYMTNWTWDFGDSVKLANVNPANHTYSDTVQPDQVTVRLKFTDTNGCDTTITNIFTLKDPVLTIPNLFTPNGDEVNDTFEIWFEDDQSHTKDFRVAYLGNELYVYDRWGRKVFNEPNYKSKDWDGSRLSDGTYYYILQLTGQYGDDVKKGTVTIMRGN